MRLLVIAICATLFSTVSSAPAGSFLAIEQFNGKKTGGHIVRLKKGASRSKVLEKIHLIQGDLSVTHLSIINGFSGTLDPPVLQLLRSSDQVESISEDGVVRPFEMVTQ